METEKVFEEAVRSGIREGIKQKLTSSYSNPFEKLVQEAVAKNSGEFRELLESSIASCIKEETFRADVATQVRSQLAKTLVQRFGGEMEKQVNVLKSDPTTRARITLAIEEIVKQGTK